MPSRRRLLHAAGAATAAAFAGCASTPAERTYALSIQRIDQSPVEHALYEPDADSLFGDPERTALADVLPDGRHTTYGYRPLPRDAYVERDGTYYQTKYVVTGRERVDRPLVRATPVPREDVPDDAVVVDALDRPSARVVKILHTHEQSGSTSDLLRGDAYVPRRPAELESRLVDGDLDGRVVTMTPDGSWAYRLDVTRTRILETRYTAFAVEVADSRASFRDVVFGARIDAELSPSDLSSDARQLLERTIRTETSDATEPLPDAFEALLTALGLERESENGRLLWYDGGLFRYGLYVDRPS
ncbi:hypothetical protein J2754_001327 [Halarchaeum solikamskense]|uniref:hypothetical protein n=1 Tax=Halarchaeum nitratireducens TaxID=489913 RepID=UPI001B3B15A6|nr:hypothetical protein [Halarchaeum solikamskense]MBP2251006.1 hypothetical protein [Halarchaeum solikamskense]